MRLSFIFVDDSTGLPISASEAIDVLDNTDALQKLQVNGLNAVEFQPLVPIPTAESGMIVESYWNTHYKRYF